MRGIFPIFLIVAGIAIINYGERHLPCGWANANHTDIANLIVDLGEDRHSHDHNHLTVVEAGPRDSRMLLAAPMPLRRYSYTARDRESLSNQPYEVVFLTASPRRVKQGLCKSLGSGRTIIRVR